MSQKMTFNEILAMEPLDLADWLKDNYTTEVPVSIETCEDLKEAGKLLSTLTNTYSFAMSLSTYAKLAVKDAKRKKIDKDAIDTAMDRKFILEDFCEIVKLQYTAISRMITVKKQIDDEMRMA